MKESGEEKKKKKEKKRKRLAKGPRKRWLAQWPTNPIGNDGGKWTATETEG